MYTTLNAPLQIHGLVYENTLPYPPPSSDMTASPKDKNRLFFQILFILLDNSRLELVFAKDLFNLTYLQCIVISYNNF